MEGTVIGKDKREETHGTGSGEVQDTFVETIYCLTVQLFDKVVSFDVPATQYDTVEIGQMIFINKEISTLEKKRLYFICAFNRKSLFYTSHEETYYL